MSAGDSATAYSFSGVLRRTGTVGVRDRVLVLPSVICSHVVADRIAAMVDGAVSAPHDHGCAQLGADNEQTRRTFLGLARNPNVAGVVVVGLGCEELQSDGVAAEMESSGVEVRELAIQGVGGTDACVESGASAAAELADGRGGRREPATLSDLTVGVVSSDLADSTVDQADPLAGKIVQNVVEAGGRAVVAGSERLVARPDAARERTASDAIPELEALFDRHRGAPAKVTRVAGRARGLPFADATAAWGGRRIDEVLAYGERASVDSGLAVVDAPSQFAEAATGLVTAGAQIVLHVTADGIPAGHPLAPVVKVSGDAKTVAALPDDVDLDANATSVDDALSRLLAVADGAPSAAEKHGLSEFAITRVGPSM
ncbi:UxaA family hydrolase [Halegenticoccus tardaugens]|uniref:UxaA family hydrolase n=1 Tax=Halegenticoccus tardaugens TaxID=2071624 RepID=UPI00100BC9F2|nr:UxaA family hydrolase [Halegenticoccus tardaugens]